MKQVTAYKCEYCNKLNQWTHHIKRHERFCKHNPNNRHKCFEYCKHLKLELYDDHHGVVYSKGFKCLKTGKNMYSYKAEKSIIIDVREEGERMPLECKYFETMLQF